MSRQSLLTLIGLLTIIPQSLMVMYAVGCAAPQDLRTALFWAIISAIGWLTVAGLRRN